MLYMKSLRNPRSEEHSRIKPQVILEYYTSKNKIKGERRGKHEKENLQWLVCFGAGAELQPSNSSANGGKSR